MKRDLTELELPPPLSPKRQAAHRSVFSEDYKVVREIGRGSSGVVYEARHRATGLRAAVKVIYRVGLNATEEQAIRHEQEIIQSLNHPNIIKCYHFYDEPTVFYIILEYVTGGELFDRIVEKSHYTEKEARDLVELILLIVKHCHDRDIVHRDLKPENLLLVSVDDDEAVKLADFGMATKTEGDDLSGLFGSPAYVAPEVILGRSYGKAVDMWSLGVLVFVLLGGYLPFGDGGSWAQTQQNIIRGRFNFTDYPQVWGPVTENAKDLIRKLLHVNVDKRMNAEEALNHPWIHHCEKDLASRHLGDNFVKLKEFNAARKFKSSVRAVMLIDHFVHKHHDHHEDDTPSVSPRQSEQEHRGDDLSNVESGKEAFVECNTSTNASAANPALGSPTLEPRKRKVSEECDYSGGMRSKGCASSSSSTCSSSGSSVGGGTKVVTREPSSASTISIIMSGGAGERKRIGECGSSSAAEKSSVPVVRLHRENTSFLGGKLRQVSTEFCPAGILNTDTHHGDCRPTDEKDTDICTGTGTGTGTGRCKGEPIEERVDRKSCILK